MIFKKNRVWWLFLLIPGAFALAALESCRLVRQDSEAIREHFLKATPIGMTRQDVIATLRNQGWNLREKDSLIEVWIGEYFSLPMYHTMVIGTWSFSASNQLVNIEIEKTKDGT